METVGFRGLFILILRLIVAGSFVLAALPKIQDPLAFANSIRGFQLIGPEFAFWVAIVLPWLELVVGIGLLTPWIRRMSAMIIAALLLLFITLHATSWLRDLDISCGCFGAEGEATGGYVWWILRNTGLLIATVIVLCRDLRNTRPTPSS